MSYRSTTLRMAFRHCPRALDFYDQGAPYDRTIFQTGVAAHAFLEAAAAEPEHHEKLFAEVAEVLATKGRSFDGEPEPPMDTRAISDGAVLARSWLESHPMDPAYQAEKGFAVNSAWSPVKYGSGEAYYKGVLDLVWTDTFEGEEYVVTRACARDYKTSWRDGAGTLDSIQMRGQACLLRAVYPDVGVIVIEVANLRSGALYTRSIVMDDEGEALLAQWRKDIDLAVRQADARLPDGRRHARPGPGCMDCPYLLRCESAAGFIRGTVLEGLPVEGARRAVATRLAVVDAMREELMGLAKVMFAEEAEVLDGGGVGYRPQTKKVARKDGAERLTMAWFGVSADELPKHERVVGLLKALSPGSTALSKAAQVAHPFTKADPDWKAKRAALLEELLEEETTSVFGVWND